MALIGVVILVRHRRADANCHMRQQPGTIAAAVALAGSSDLSVLVRPSDSIKDMGVILQDYTFKIDNVSFYTRLLLFYACCRGVPTRELMQLAFLLLQTSGCLIVETPRDASRLTNDLGRPPRTSPSSASPTAVEFSPSPKEKTEFGIQQLAFMPSLSSMSTMVTKRSSTTATTEDLV